MRAAIVHQFGDADVLRVEERDRPSLRDHEILVRVIATSVNPVDIKVRTRGGFGIEPPAILGYDVSGTVEKVGADVGEFRVGDEVFYTPEIDDRGSYAEYHAVDQAIVARKPRGMPHEEAATLPLAGCTAIQALLDRAGLQAGETALIHGDGGVGSLAVQLARAAGARVFVVGGDSLKDELPALGADRVIDYRRDDFREIVSRETDGAGVEVVLDTVGGDVLARSIPCLALYGRMTTIVETARGLLGPAIARNGQVDFVLAQRDGGTMARLLRLVERGQMRPVVDRVVPLEGIADAHRAVEQGGVRGKIAVTTAPR